MPQKTTVCWFEIGCSDMTRATAFYSKLFGWEYQSFGDPSYQLVRGLSTDALGGALFSRKDPSVAPNTAGTTITFSCDDCGATARAAVALGAKLASDKAQIAPDMGFLAQIDDTEGNRVGLWSMN